MQAIDPKARIVLAFLYIGQAALGQPLTPRGAGSTSATKPGDALIGRTRQGVVDFAKALPDFICHEVISRFQTELSRPGWLPVDVVTTDLVYENGKEDYRQVKVNGKSPNKRMEQLRGAWSTGEFGSILIQLFAPSTAADFRFVNDATLGGKHVRTYSFTVARENSQWMVEADGQATQPAYGGSVSIEPETARVLRIEMQAHNLPERFPASRVESATDYQYVEFGGERYLLPSHCETLTCEPGSLHCARNIIYFVDYHKYTSESNIRFGSGKQD